MEVTTHNMKYNINDVIKGLMLVSQPYKINGKNGYRAMVKCTLCDKDPYEIVISAIKNHKYDGCPDCANRQRFKTHEQFISEMREVQADIIVTGKYTASNVKIDWVCAVCGHQFSSLPNNLLKGHGCKMCANKLLSLRKRRTHDDFVKMLKSIHSDIEIVGTYVRSSEKVRCRCIVDGYEWDAWPDHLLSGHGCPVCRRNSLFVGYNDIMTIRPDLVKYFKNAEDSTKFTQHSGQYVDLVCPYCGHEKRMIVEHLSRGGFACSVCGDGISYPNKFCRHFFKQLPVENLQYEYTSYWTESYLYDIYFEYCDIKYIVEVDGLQHFRHTSNLWQPFEIVRQTDHVKTQLAINNGCVVIRIDCQKSDMQYIKNNILNSYISDIFDLSNIDWIVCEESARTSLVYEVCDFYNTSNNKQVKYISKQFGISEPTARKYLRIGSDIGICNYHSKAHQLGVVAYHLNDNKTFSFQSASMCAKELSVLYNTYIESKGVLRTCRGEQKSYKNFIFKFKDGDIYEQSS